MEKIIERLGLLGIVGAPALLLLSAVTGWAWAGWGAAVCLGALLLVFGGAALAHTLSLPGQIIQGLRDGDPKQGEASDGERLAGYVLAMSAGFLAGMVWCDRRSTILWGWWEEAFVVLGGASLGYVLARLTFWLLDVMRSR